MINIKKIIPILYNKWMGTLHSPKLQHYRRLTVRSFSVISRLLVGHTPRQRCSRCIVLLQGHGPLWLRLGLECYKRVSSMPKKTNEVKTVDSRLYLSRLPSWWKRLQKKKKKERKEESEKKKIFLYLCYCVTDNEINNIYRSTICSYHR